MSVWRAMGSLFGGIVLVCCGCAGDSTVRLYDGKRLQAAQACRIMNSDSAVVRSVDGQLFHRDKHAYITAFELRPGRHRVTAGPPGFGSPADYPNHLARTFDFDFKPGRTYGFTVLEVRGGGLDAYDVRLVDYETGKVVSRGLNVRSLLGGGEPGIRYD